MGKLRNSVVRSRESGRNFWIQLSIDATESIVVLARIRNRYFDRISYSQYGEDKVLRALLPEKFGTYLDVGAGHPISNSNTFWFYKRGWRGTLIEPLVSLSKKSLKKRQRDNLVQSLIGISSEKTFWEFYPTEYSTSDREIAQKCMDRGVKLVSEYQLTSVPLSSIAPNMTPKEPTFMDIDVEGSDLEVLKTNDWSRCLPRVVVVEDRAALHSSPSEIELYLGSIGYSLISIVAQSCIFIHDSYELGWNV